MKSTPTKKGVPCVISQMIFFFPVVGRMTMELAGFESGSQGTESPVTQQPQSQQLMEMSRIASDKAQ